MKLVSFDVGIKNMAYCFFDISGENIGVKDWNVINLMPDANKNTVLCNCNIIIKGNKKKISNRQSNRVGIKLNIPRMNFVFAKDTPILLTY